MSRLLKSIALTVVLLSLPSTSRATFLTYVTILNGPNESPANNSPGFGTATVDIDTVANTMRVRVSFTGLTSNTTASHIHAATATPGTGTAGVATTTPTFANFPLNATAGTYDQTFDMTLAASYNPAFVTLNGNSVPASESALFASIAAGTSYLNIHTVNFPSGEIRGFLSPVPEPASLVLIGIGSIGLASIGRRRPSNARE